MTLQRRHFQTIADSIAKLPVSERTRRKVAVSFADDLRFTNPNFDRDRFLEACR